MTPSPSADDAVDNPQAAPHREAAAVAQRYARRDAEADAQRYSLFDPAALQAHQERQRAMLALWRAQGWAALAGRDVLEVGCGAGGNLIDLLRLGADASRLAGIDLLPDRVAAARARLPQAVRLIEGDALHAPIADESQDLVLAFTVFSSLLDDAVQQQLAAAMWRWLRPGGGVLCHDFCVDNPGNADVRAVPVRRLRALFPQARMAVRRVTLAPPIARRAARVHAALPAVLNALPLLAPLMRTHRLCWLVKS